MRSDQVSYLFLSKLCHKEALMWLRYDGGQGGAASWRAPARPACQCLHVDDEYECDDGTDEVAVMSMGIVRLIMMMLHSPSQLYNIIIVLAAVDIIQPARWER